MRRDAGNLFQYFRTRTKKCATPSSKTARPQSVDASSQPSSGLAGQEIRRTKVNFIFDNLEDQDEVCSDASAFQREEVELATYFLTWRRYLTSHVARPWTFSIWLISALSFADLASMAYSGCGRAMVQFSGIKSYVDSSENDWQSSSCIHSPFAVH